MPSNGIIYLPNSPIQIYNVESTEEEVANGLTTWENTAYDQRLEQCEFVGTDYCNPVLMNDQISFQFKAATTGSELFQAFIATPADAGVNTSTATNHLIQSGQNFTSTVQAGYLVRNTADNSSSFVINVDSDTDLELNDDVFLATGKAFVIDPILVTGTWKWQNSGHWYIDNSAFSSLTFELGLTDQAWYKVTIKIDDLTSGKITLVLGTNSFVEIDSVGTHTIYGKCDGGTDFVIQASSEFIGSIDYTKTDIYEVQTQYTVAFWDLNDTLINSFAHSEASNSLSIGNIVISASTWGDYLSDCGNYRLSIFEGVEILCPAMVKNGDFKESEGWTDSGPTVTIFNEQLEFDDAKEGDNARNELSCPITNGRTYYLQWDVRSVSDLGEIIDGSYQWWTDNFEVSPVYSPLLQIGQTVSLTFTAQEDSNYLYIYAVGENSTFAIDNVIMYEIDPGINGSDGISECFCICDTQDCTILLKYRNGKNAFGYYYENEEYFNYLRIHAAILSPRITDDEYEEYKNTLRTIALSYFDGMKIEELATDLLPAWVHNALALALKHNQLYINGVRYVGIEEHNYKEDKTEVFTAQTKIARYSQKFLNNVY